MPSIHAANAIAGVLVVEPQVWGDERGVFVETFRQEWLPDNAPTMVQANRADRQAGSLVGLHYHRFQSDFWYVPFGRAFVALHDLRVSSPTDGVSMTLEIGPDHRGIYIPPGVAHGFYALTDMTITYLVDGYYNPEDELGVAWNDPELAITWPNNEPVLSKRDQSNPKRGEIPQTLRPR
ncbi:MAG: dTDP-4-dehydrorhamnose 3,5-epimerase family protein [Acidimicrobiia bacterium]